jgi:hypothetical protein
VLLGRDYTGPAARATAGSTPAPAPPAAGDDAPGSSPVITAGGTPCVN